MFLNGIQALDLRSRILIGRDRYCIILIGLLRTCFLCVIFPLPSKSDVFMSRP